MRAAERAEPMRRQGGKRNRYRDQRTAAEKEAVLIKRTHQQKSPTVCDAPDSHKTSRLARTGPNGHIPFCSF